ncbi:pantoate--beta-alanine ligase [Chitinophaga sp. SYP-B3965]|uniref:pantoate--beta-alanine ligase n=1 Tax=Chitinophaga sp. SYP-B3965 TaxID=2663120 RepID=UPI001299D017|nr:pantoate--beta-alanine ligase [Chitinophaga sp. SYP-B3965]MRG44337.1 pantoate--beta-alanine ligase [Chitinophaga sp. SYP-B3965]
MYLFKQVADLKEALEHEKKAGKRIGFVPTMGALHEGHLSLIRDAKALTDIVVCSIFVNPTQFNDPKDFEKYPITIKEDILKLNSVDTDILFIPSVAEMYPEGVNGMHLHYDFGYLETVLEGAFRQNHFQGVGIVVHKLLDIVQPHDLFMGQKDFQQCMIIKRLLKITGIPSKLHISPTLRENDGLAMSSRNMRLNQTERQTATQISRTLTWMKENIRQMPFPVLKENAGKQLQDAGFQLDYIEIADAANLQLLDKTIEKEMVMLVAAKLGEIRLIDNMIVS